MAPATERQRGATAAFEPKDTNRVWRGTAGVVTGLPLVLLRSEGVALLAMAAVLYGRYGRSWWLFLALLPVPDAGLLGLLWSKRVGAVTYDLTHTYVPPAALGLVGLLTGSGLAVALALVWFAHIGMDRALGLGLQYPDGSDCTHLSQHGNGRLRSADRVGHPRWRGRSRTRKEPAGAQYRCCSWSHLPWVGCAPGHDLGGGARPGTGGGADRGPDRQ